jgi:hypothetical protein
LCQSLIWNILSILSKGKFGMKWNIVGQGDDVEWSGEHVSLGLVNKKSVSDGYTGRKQKLL